MTIDSDNTCAELHRAIERNDHGAVINYLFQISADCEDEIGRTALHRLAESRKHENMFLHLKIFGGATFGVQSHDGMTPLMVAIACGNRQAIANLFEHDCPANSINLNAQNAAGFTALHIAVIKNEPEIVAFLLKLGAVATIKDSHQRTPLMIAELLGFAAITQTIKALRKFY